MEKLKSDGTRRNTAINAAAALFLAILVFVLVFFSLEDGCIWGDDHSAYILQGISIAEGNFHEQARTNYILHPSFMPDEAKDGELVYVWGYSLIQAAVYRAAGYDRGDFDSLIYYKLPSVISFALLSAVLFLFLRRRFSLRLSFFLSLLFSLSPEFLGQINTMYSDVVFLFFAVLSLYLCELYLDCRGRRRIIAAIVFGVLLWFMYEVRLNGISILLACALGHVISLVQNREELRPRQLLAELLPYAVFLILKLISEAILSPATSNTSDLADTNLGVIAGNLMYYFRNIRELFGSMWGNIPVGFSYMGFAPGGSNTLFVLRSVLANLSLVLCLAGMLTDGIRKNTHLTVFILTYIGVASMLAYNQGLRYIYPILPVLLMYMGYGISRLISLSAGFLPEIKRGKRALSALCTIALVLICAAAAYPRCISNRALQENGGINPAQDAEYVLSNNAFSPEAVEAYKYVNENIPPDSVVGFFKPRLLYLNTGRVSVTPLEIIGHSLDECDYYLVFKKMIINPEPGENFVPIWENEGFIMYEKIPEA